MGEEIEIFISYAHEDELLKQQLEKQLRGLQRLGTISVWHDRKISPGTPWPQAIDAHLNTAKIILLLVSPDFIDSDYAYSIEMKRALKRHERNEARVIPVILRPIHWQHADFGVLQALPTGAKPITSWRNRDEAFFSVAESIREVVGSLSARSSPVRHTIEFSIEEGGIQSFHSDVVAVKYAEGSRGADQAIIDPLEKVGIPELRPAVGAHRYVTGTYGPVQATSALIVGVPPIHVFNYQAIQRFTTEVLGILADKAPDTQHLTMTTHGTGAGSWNPVEALLAQFAGYIDAIQSGRLPPFLKRISVVEINHGRVQQLGQALEQHLASTDYASRVPTQDRWIWRVTSR